jgi:hypothetical protein
MGHYWGIHAAVLLEVLIGVHFRTGYHTQASEIYCKLNEFFYLSTLLYVSCFLFVPNHDVFVCYWLLHCAVTSYPKCHHLNR